MGGLRERERQIASPVVAVSVAVIAVAAVVFVVVVSVNGCVASAAAPEVHVLPGQGWRHRAIRDGEVFPRGQRQRRSNPKVVE